MKTKKLPDGWRLLTPTETTKPGDFCTSKLNWLDMPKWEFLNYNEAFQKDPIELDGIWPLLNGCVTFGGWILNKQEFRVHERGDLIYIRRRVKKNQLINGWHASCYSRIACVILSYHNCLSTTGITNKTVKQLVKHKLVMSNITINRNNIDLVCGTKEKGRGTSKGETYMGFIDLDKQPFSTLVNFVSEDKAKDLLIAFLNRNAIGWTNEATNDDTGEFNQELFIQLANGMSVRGESMADLKEKLAELVTFVSSEEAEALGTDALRAKMREIRDLNAAIANKKRERKPKAEVAEPAAA